MSKVQRETAVCYGRGFANADAGANIGLLSRFVSFIRRPNADGAPKTITFDYTTDICTCVAHGFNTGDSVKLTTTGSLPGNLQLLTEYYIIKINVDTFYLATNHYLATIGTHIDIITNNGSGTHSIYVYGSGMGWTLIDNFAYNTDKTFAPTDVNVASNVITITNHGFSQLHYVQFSSTGTLPGGINAGQQYYVKPLDVNTLQVFGTLQGAIQSSVLDITSQGTGTHTISPKEFFMVFCDAASPTVNSYNGGLSGLAPKFIKIGYYVTDPGYIQQKGMMWWDTSVAGCHGSQSFWSGAKVATADSANFTYDFRGGDEFCSISAKIGAAWQYTIIDEWTGLANMVEGTDKVGVLQSGVTAGSNVVISLATGQENNFTVNNFYYIYDFSSLNRVGYGKCTAKDTSAHTITIDTVSYNFPTGSVVCAYAHRFYSLNSGTWYGNAQLNNGAMNIPYSSYNTSCFYNQYGGYMCNDCFQVSLDDLIGWTAQSVPDDMGNYWCVRRIVCEQYTANSTSNPYGNRMYGKSKNILRTWASGLVQMQDYRTLNGVDYLMYGPSSSKADFIRHSVSAS